jgi:hypothetical protein
VDSARLISHPHSAADQARDARARAWAFAFSCAKKNAAGITSTNGDDTMKGSKNDDRATKQYTR